MKLNASMFQENNGNPGNPAENPSVGFGPLGSIPSSYSRCGDTGHSQGKGFNDGTGCASTDAEEEEGTGDGGGNAHGAGSTSGWGNDDNYRSDAHLYEWRGLGPVQLAPYETITYRTPISGTALGGTALGFFNN